MEAIIRLSAFVIVVVLMIVWEYYAPRRVLTYSRWQRWFTNLSLLLIGILVVRLLMGGAAYLAAVDASELNIGLLNQFELPHWLLIVVSLLVLDLAIYGQHVVSHRWKWLWRLHKIHHTDLDFDVTTAVRFHPIEILISMVYKVFIIYIIGADVMAVIAFEVILNISALFNHSNITIPLAWDKGLRKVIVTPDMHRIHHSAIQSETDSNYGFSLSIWDRLFNNYTQHPQQDHRTMQIGLQDYRQSDDLGIKQLLVMPFRPK